mgnify:CR=1 FL=1
MKYLGIDFGLKRIGLATSEGELASPLKIVEIRNLNDAVVKMIQIILTEKIDRVVVGMPEGETGRIVKKFIKKLQLMGVDVIKADETLSTVNAIDMMIRSGVPRSKRRFTDAQAAAEILQNYLDGT